METIMGELLQMATFPPKWIGMDQKHRVLYHFEQGKSLTRAEANRLYSVGNLPDIVWKLKREGYSFNEVWETKVNQFGEKYRCKRWSFKEVKT